MKRGAKQLRTSKLKFLKQEPVVVTDITQSQTVRSVRDFLCAENRVAFCGEIHQTASYNGSSFEGPLSDLAAQYDKYVDVLVVATDNTVFSDGNFSMLREAKAKTSKPVVALDLFLTKEQIAAAFQEGADAIILIISILETDELADLTTYAHSLGLEVIAEVQDEEEVGRALQISPDVICINTRDIDDLAVVDMGKIHRLRPLITEGIPTIAASGIKTNYDIHRHCVGCDGVLIGSAILESRNISGALEYFQKGEDNYPFVWVRPAAFLFLECLRTLQQELGDVGFSVKYTFKVLNTECVFAAMYQHKFREQMQEGRKYYAVMSEGLRQIRRRGGNPDYSEVWFLETGEKLTDVYHKLLDIKARIRARESTPITSVWVDGDSMPVQLHSLHTPDPSLYEHRRDLTVLSSFREYTQNLASYLE